MEDEADHGVDGVEEFVDVDGLRVGSIGELQFEVLPPCFVVDEPEKRLSFF